MARPLSASPCSLHPTREHPFPAPARAKGDYTEATITILTLKDVATYVRGEGASGLLLTILRRARRVFNFIEERHNRLSRYIAVVNAYTSGMPLNAIEEKFGCTRRTIYDYVERAGVSKRSLKPEKIKAAALKEYADKSISIASIISRHNVSYRQLHTWARKAGLRRNRQREK